MNKLEIIETLVKAIPCPICLNSRFQVYLNCELPKSPCDYHAVCGHCQHKIIVTSDTKTMEEVWVRVNEHIKQQGCPECGDHKLHLLFLCDVNSEDCFFLVRCGDNRHYSRLSPDKTQFLFQ